MLRRDFLAMGLAGALPLGGQEKRDEAIASATQDTTPRVGIVLSSFAEGTEHDGTKLKGLENPRPTDADLTDPQMEAWVRKAIEMGSDRTGELHTVITSDDWVVIKTNIACCYGLGPETKDGGAHQPYIPGTVTDLRIVRALLNYLVEHNCGARISMVEGSGQWLPMERSKSPVDGWTTDWGGAYSGLSYKKLVEDFSKRYPKVRFETIDLNFADAVELPVPGKALARRNPSGVYTIAKVLQQCDRLISVMPLKTDATLGVALSMKNYAGFAPGAKYGFPKKSLLELGSPDEVIVDLFSYHPADYSLIGGCFAVEGDGPAGPGASSLHYNVLISGTKAVAVDTVGAVLMGFDPAQFPFLDLAAKKGYGLCDPDLIWMRGSEPDEAKKPFRKPSTWKKGTA
jgi:hypothetical protein